MLKVGRLRQLDTHATCFISDVRLLDMIARFDPKTSEWIEFALPEAESDPRRIDIDPTNPNRIFFSGNIPGRVGFIEVLPQ